MKKVVFAIVLLAAPLVRAHDTWVIPNTFRVPKGAQVTFSITSGMEFPKFEVAVKEDRIARATIDTRNGRIPLDHATSEAHALQFSRRMQSNGVAVVAIESNPRSIELTPREVDEYLDEIGAKESVGPIWNAMPEPKRWRELYVKHAKTFIRVGDAGGDRTWSKPTGMRFELVPASDPTDAHGGQPITFTLLEDGKRAASLPIGVVHEGSKGFETLTTDHDGRVTIRSLTAGRYLIRATKLRRSSSKQYDWESDFTTVTFEVTGLHE